MNDKVRISRISITDGSEIYIDMSDRKWDSSLIHHCDWQKDCVEQNFRQIIKFVPDNLWNDWKIVE